MKIVIIKYNAGNIESVKNALDRLNVTSKITDNIEQIRNADKVIFPGVGEASTTMEYLRNNGLDKLIISLKQPVFIHQNFSLKVFVHRLRKYYFFEVTPFAY